ncbi:MAG: hypothetical protein IKH57_09235 [Clostridia bacterium]|nr:hypothetical protein [Clostridia bacterium]
MNMKKAIALLLALYLLVTAVPAFAAPTRDAQAVEVTVDEKLLSLTELVVNAAILQNTPAEPAAESSIPGLAKDELPSDLLVSCVLAWGIKAGVLPYSKEIGKQETIALGKAEAQDLYQRVFTNTAYTVEYHQQEAAEQIKADNQMRTWYAGGELNLAYASLCDYGVYIYSAVFDGTDAEILCDVFSMNDGQPRLNPEDIPEEAMTWQCSARISLRSAPESAFGYTLNSFEISPFYQDGDLSKWPEFENAEKEYSVNLPSILGVADDTPANRVWQTADGKASLTIAVQDKTGTYDDALAQYMAEHPGAKVTQQREFDFFSESAEGKYTLVVISELKDNVYTVTMVFPAERQAEYEFYAEIIRNSLTIWGVSNG